MAVMTRNVAEALLEHHFDDVRKGLRIGSLEIAKFSERQKQDA